MSIFEIVQGLISTIMTTAGFGVTTTTTLPSELISAVESCGFFESIPLWAVTLIRRTCSQCIIIYNGFYGIW